MTNALASPKRTLNRAKHHILDLHQRVAAFLIQKPYAGVVEFDSTTTKYLHKLKLTKPFPDDFATIAADAAGNLRDVLDQVGYAVAVAAGATDPDYGAFFPFCGREADFEHVAKDRCKFIPHDILTLFRSFKPYKGGNDLLWALNRICNTKKHKLIVPISMNYGAASRRF